jgi:hypothetical protein
VNALVEKIRSRGHWEVTLRPSKFVERRIDSLAQLERGVREARVELRGWDYPHIQPDDIKRMEDFLEESVDWHTHRELWRCYQSGLFFHTFGMWEDWWDQELFGTSKIESGTILSYLGALYTFTEVFLFAARLAESLPIGPELVLSYRLIGIGGRQLSATDPNRAPFPPWYKTAAELKQVQHEITVDVSTLVAQSKTIAVDEAIRLYEYFHWQPAKLTLIEEQRRFIERRI